MKLVLNQPDAVPLAELCTLTHRNFLRHLRVWSLFCMQATLNLTINLVTDNYGDETTWAIRDACIGRIIATDPSGDFNDRFSYQES
jgi:hypothetical protein